MRLFNRETIASFPIFDPEIKKAKKPIIIRQNQIIIVAEIDFNCNLFSLFPNIQIRNQCPSVVKIKNAFKKRTWKENIMQSFVDKIGVTKS